MEGNKQLVVLAREQQTTLKKLMAKLFDKSLEGLSLTKGKIEDLRKRHEWYHSNIYQLHQLKKKISSIQGQYDGRINEILREIQEEKERIKQILQKALNRLKTMMDKTLVKQYLDELMREFDTLIDKVSTLVLLGSIFGALGLFVIIATIIVALGGSTILGVATLGLGGVVGGAAASENMFRSKLSDLNEKLATNIESVRSQKSQQLQRLDTYFDGFAQKLDQDNSLNLTVDIVWFDENIQSNVNQAFANRLLREFSSGKYRVILFDNETTLIQFVQTNIKSNIILITSGSAGEAVISDIGYYWNIKGIIIFSRMVDNDRSWAGQYKKVLLVTTNSDEVIQKIKHVECGDVYFLINGFSLEDARLKLTNLNDYLSTRDHGFMIQNFESINPNISDHRTTIGRLHNRIVSENIYPNGIPNHFELTNLYQFVDKFLEALRQTKSENAIIALYTRQAPYYFKITNDILNRLDEELISLIGDYIKALRYALIVYVDATNRIPNTADVKLYRGFCLKHGNSLQEFQRKFRVTDVIIFPSFLSTSLNRTKAISFTKGKGILLEISADCTQVNKPKNISAESHHKSEDEVLLNCFSVLKVMSITQISTDLWCYKCTLSFGDDN